MYRINECVKLVGSLSVQLDGENLALINNDREPLIIENVNTFKIVDWIEYIVLAIENSKKASMKNSSAVSIANVKDRYYGSISITEVDILGQVIAVICKMSKTGFREHIVTLEGQISRVCQATKYIGIQALMNNKSTLGMLCSVSGSDVKVLNRSNVDTIKRDSVLCARVTQGSVGIVNKARLKVVNDIKNIWQYGNKIYRIDEKGNCKVIVENTDNKRAGLKYICTDMIMEYTYRTRADVERETYERFNEVTIKDDNGNVRYDGVDVVIKVGDSILAFIIKNNKYIEILMQVGECVHSFNLGTGVKSIVCLSGDRVFIEYADGTAFIWDGEDIESSLIDEEYSNSNMVVFMKAM